VDRGAWGVEVLAVLMAYKWLYPHNVYLVRGNHESNIITQVYGFAAELKAKYGKAAKVIIEAQQQPRAAGISNSSTRQLARFCWHCQSQGKGNALQHNEMNTAGRGATASMCGLP
jgi:hypothetical protein